MTRLDIPTLTNGGGLLLALVLVLVGLLAAQVWRDSRRPRCHRCRAHFTRPGSTMLAIGSNQPAQWQTVCRGCARTLRRLGWVDL